MSTNILEIQKDNLQKLINYIDKLIDRKKDERDIYIKDIAIIEYKIHQINEEKNNG